MTYQKFKAIAEKYRPDIKVSQHGDYCTGKSKYTLGIVFYRDGKESRVYNYSGTYADILNRLGIPVITESAYKTVINSLETYKKLHGTICEFFGDIIDYSEQIAETEEKIRYYNSDKVVREWEV